MNMDALRVDTNSYADQFRNALNVNGGDIENASNMDYIMHFLTFGWKVCLFSLVYLPHVRIAYFVTKAEKCCFNLRYINEHQFE